MKDTLRHWKGGKPYLSHSQIDMYTKCGEQYRRRYVEGERMPPGIAAMKGTGVHRATEVNMKQKVHTREDLRRDDVVGIAVEAFEVATHDGFALTDEESSRGSRVVIGEAKDELVEMATVASTCQFPDYQPAEDGIEKLVRIELPNSPRDLLGVIDMIDEQDRVTDFKTSGRTKSQNEADTSVQLGIYDVAFRALKSREPKELRLDTIVRTRTRTAREVRVTHRSPADLAALANRINTVQAGIAAGIFAPAPPGAWWCSEKFCGFHATCPYVSRGNK